MRSSAGALRSSALVLERQRPASSAPVFARIKRMSIAMKLSAPVREAHSSCSPILEVLFY
jgi:hypothetical protein